MRRALVLFSVLVLSGCQPGQPAATASPSVSSPVSSPSLPIPEPFPASSSRSRPPTVTTQPAGTLIAVLEGSSLPFTLKLVTPAGEEALSYVLPSSYYPVSAGGDLVLLRSDGGQITGLTRKGVLYDLGTLPGSTSTGPLLSPDGSQWVWSADQWDQATGIYHSSVSAGPAGTPGATVERSDDQGRDLRPFNWGARGAVVEHGAVGIGGYFVFYNATGPVDVVDQAAGAASPLAFDATTCSFSDVSLDGQVACISAAAAPALKVFAGGQARATVALPQPAYRLAGAAYFRPGSSTQLVVGGAQGAGPPSEKLQTALVDLATGSLKAVGPPNARPAPGPWCWMADGSLILEVPEFSAGPNPGTYLVRPDGTSTRIATGTPVGILSA